MLHYDEYMNKLQTFGLLAALSSVAAIGAIAPAFAQVLTGGTASSGTAGFTGAVDAFGDQTVATGGSATGSTSCQSIAVIFIAASQCNASP